MGLLLRSVAVTAVALVAAQAPARRARAGDFMDTRITWTFGDDDFLADAGENIPNSPLPSIGDRPGYELFMDNIDSRYTGRENQTHLVMYKRVAGFFPRLSTEGAMVIQFDLREWGPVLADDGSYLRIRYGFDDDPEEDGGDGLAVVFFPFDTERFRLGALWDISWGGGGIFTNKRSGFTPGLKLETDIGPGRYFAGFKTARISELRPDQTGGDGEPANVQETNYGGLFGAAFDLTDWLRLDAGGGFFEQGTFDQPGLEGQRVYSFGGSARVVVHSGIPVPESADFKLYRNEPWALDAPAGEGGPGAGADAGGFGWMVSLEGTVLGQHLADQGELGVVGASLIQPAYAAALQGRIRTGGFRAYLVGFYRSLEFILHNVPSFTPFVALRGGQDVSPQFFLATGVEFPIEGPRLTPSVLAGVQFPASVTAGGQTIVVRDEENRDNLPPGEEAVPVISARVSLRWDLSSILSLHGMLQYERDENATRLARDADGTYRTYRRFDRLGGALIAQARF